MRFCLTSGVTAVIAFIALASAPGLPVGPAAAYSGELQLPVTLYSSDGTELEKGEFHVDLRSEKGSCMLVFLRGSDSVKVVNGVAEASENVTATAPTLPLIGTVYLYESKTPKGSEEEKRPADEKPNVTFIEHLGARPWKAALRAYCYPQPGPPEVVFVLKEQKSPGEWIRTDFKLFRTRPLQ